MRSLVRVGDCLARKKGILSAGSDEVCQNHSLGSDLGTMCDFMLVHMVFVATEINVNKLQRNGLLLYSPGWPLIHCNPVISMWWSK